MRMSPMAVTTLQVGSLLSRVYPILSIAGLETLRPTSHQLPSYDPDEHPKLTIN